MGRGMGMGMGMGLGMGGNNNSVVSPVHSPALMSTKPPTMPSNKPKAMAPPVATFQTKTFEY